MITRVYGKADNFELEFAWDGSVWNAAVPADLSDGKYVCEFWALDSYGYTAYYTGILYMFDGNAVLDIVKDTVIFEFYQNDILLIHEVEMNLELINDTISISYIGEESVGEWCGD